MFEALESSSAVNTGWVIAPVPTSVTIRLRSKSFDGQCSAQLRRTATKTTEFSSVAEIASKMLIAAPRSSGVGVRTSSRSTLLNSEQWSRSISADEERFPDPMPLSIFQGSIWTPCLNVYNVYCVLMWLCKFLLKGFIDLVLRISNWQVFYQLILHCVKRNSGEEKSSCEFSLQIIISLCPHLKSLLDSQRWIVFPRRWAGVLGQTFQV